MSVFIKDQCFVQAKVVEMVWQRWLKLFGQRLKWRVLTSLSTQRVAQLLPVGCAVFCYKPGAGEDVQNCSNAKQ
jgi:hypothetical protein